MCAPYRKATLGGPCARLAEHRPAACSRTRRCGPVQPESSETCFIFRLADRPPIGVSDASVPRNRGERAACAPNHPCSWSADRRRRGRGRTACSTSSWSTRRDASSAGSVGVGGALQPERRAVRGRASATPYLLMFYLSTGRPERGVYIWALHSYLSRAEHRVERPCSRIQ